MTLPKDHILLANLISERLARGRQTRVPAGRTVRDTSAKVFIVYSEAPHGIQLGVRVLTTLQREFELTDYDLWCRINTMYPGTEESDVAKIRSQLTCQADPPFIEDSGNRGLSRRRNSAIKWRLVDR